MIHHAHELGYETMANLMAVSNITETEIDTVLEAIAPTPAGTMVIVDSFGHLYREQIDMLYTSTPRRWKGPAKRSAFTPTTTCNWRSPTRSKRSSWGRIAPTPR